jgi:hemerythrin-like metal-binding protein
MPIITEWDPSFSVGSELLDGQHRKLLKLCNSLAENIAESSIGRQKDFHEILHELAEYSREHFATEEALLHKYRYPNLQEQHNDHVDYCRQMAETAFLTATAGVIDKIDMQRYLSKWWTEHILMRDMKYRDLLISNNAE